MRRIFRNAEFKELTGKMLILFLIAAVLLCILCTIQFNIMHARTIDQGAAVIGKVLAVHPELEREIVGAVIVQATASDIERGKAALEAYGYTVSAPVRLNSIIGDLFPWSLVIALGFLVICALAYFFLIYHGYKSVYRKVRSFSDAAEKVVDGNFSVLLPSSGEGDFEILGHRFNQMANRLKLNMEQLVAEKVFLKNIISDISHQLKTPLSTLVVYNDLMAENENMDAEHRRNFILMGRQQLQRLEWLIQSLLKMARLEAGSISFKRDKVMMRDVADAAVAALNTMATETNITICVLEKSTDAAYTGDEAWLTEAVINIVKNGIEHSLPGATIEILLDQTPLTASFVVTDHGEGIDRSDLPHIFDRFYRSSHNIKPNSIGIGLAMSKAIVEGQGGSITVRSDKNRGSEFSIVFLKTLGES